MKARQLMTASPRTCVPHDGLVTAARHLIERDCGALPVVDDPHGRRPVGILTDRDIVTRVVAKDRDPRTCSVREAMTPAPVVVHEDASFAECARLMMHHRVRRLPVVDDRGQLIGIITDGDLARATRDDALREHELAEVVREVSMPADHPSHGPCTMVVVGDAAYLSRPDDPAG